MLFSDADESSEKTKKKKKLVEFFKINFSRAVNPQF